jgi:hypothetical protein
MRTSGRNRWKARQQQHKGQNDRTVVEVEEAVMTCKGNLDIPNDGEPQDQVSMSRSPKYEAQVPHSTFIHQ